MHGLKGYELSLDADMDLEDIFDYTTREHGFNQAVRYLLNLEIIFNSPVVNPEIGRQRNEIKNGLYSLAEQQHVIFYRILNDHIRIVRVLHGSKDIPNHF